ncbi:MAG TPA: glycine zipper family protein [Polyangiaceae bacterium]|nr:glycine zipper family protein [Polyangiaceae bacterium]
MAQLFAAALSFPGAVYTVLLGVVILYWLFVLVGAAGVDLFADGEGAAGGAPGGSLEGAAKGAAEGALGGHGEAGPGHAEAGIEAPPHGGLAGGDWVGALRLRSAPATLVVSLVVAFAWPVALLAGRAIDALGPGPAARFALGAMAAALAPLLALLPTSLLVRPLAGLFVPRTAARARRDFVGKVCTVRTGSVDASFGEALLDERGAEVVVRVRVDGGAPLGRGDRALIVAFDERRDAFTVAALDEVLGAPPRGRPGGAA